jgi:hypothetical protein
MKFLIVTASLVTLNAAVAADLPHPQPPPPASVVGKAPIGKIPVGRAPIGKYPGRKVALADRGRAPTGARYFLCIRVRRAFSRRRGARGESWASAASSLVA